jgi:hypothetical protein
VACSDLDRADDVLARAGYDYAERFNLIDARVGGIERARDGVETDFPLDSLLELMLKIQISAPRC